MSKKARFNFTSVLPFGHLKSVGWSFAARLAVVESACSSLTWCCCSMLPLIQGINELRASVVAIGLPYGGKIRGWGRVEEEPVSRTAGLFWNVMCRDFSRIDELPDSYCEAHQRRPFDAVAWSWIFAVAAGRGCGWTGCDQAGGIDRRNDRMHRSIEQRLEATHLLRTSHTNWQVWNFQGYGILENDLRLDTRIIYEPSWCISNSIGYSISRIIDRQYRLIIFDRPCVWLVEKAE